MKPFIVPFFCALLTASLMWPSEGAINGDGLHLAIGWLLLAALTAFWGRTNAPPESAHRTTRLVRCLPVALLIGGFWLSTWYVFRAHGDRRAALNLSMEWTAIGAACYVARSLMVLRTGRQWIVTLLIGLGIGVATLGILQHHVTLARQAQWYQDLRSRIDVSDSDRGLHSATDRAAAMQELQRMDIPLDGPGRELFERRLLGSTEPTGPFALANTLGGLCAVVFVLLVIGLLQGGRSGKRLSIANWAVGLLCCAVVAYCLMLTKSRTAWVGVAMGITWLMLQRRGAAMLRVARLATIAAVALSMIVAAGIQFGVLDKEVVLESPRSLQFRLFYWAGAAGVIGDSPVFGSGPGNFRQAYVGHKLVESSEEILDPHNIFLDAWCSAGVPGFLSICAVVISTIWRNLDVEPPGNASSTHQSPIPGLSMILAGICGGAFFHLFWRWFNGGPFIDLAGPDLLSSTNLIIVVPFGALVCISLLHARLSYSTVLLRAAMVTLLVHLLGAGGLQITVVGLLFLLLYTASFGSEGAAEADRETVVSSIRFRWLEGAMFCVLAGIVCWQGLIPVRTAEQHLQLASALRSRGQMTAADQAYRDAGQADPFATDSRQRRMELSAYLLMDSVSRYAQTEDAKDVCEALEKPLKQATQACDSMIAADQISYAGYHYRSRIRAEVNRVCPDPELQEGALHDLHKVVTMYPTNSLFWADFAELREEFGLVHDAQQAADKALEIDAVNRAWGHLDRYLADERVAGLKQIARSAEVESTSDGKGKRLAE